MEWRKNKKEFYYKKMQEKINICKDNDIKLIEILYDDLKRLHIIFESYLIDKNS